VKVTWLVDVTGKPGRQELCRNEEEAARLVLELVLAGVKLRQIIVDGVAMDRDNKRWIWKALDAR
jgi:hypothetical protein